MWLFVALTCGDGTDHETKEQKQAYVEWQKYNATQITPCSSYDEPKGSGYIVKYAGYVVQDGKKVPMEFYEGKDPLSDNGLIIPMKEMTPTPEEKAKGSGKCQTVAEILSKPPPDPLVPFTPGSANFPCNMGAKIPFGKVPTGCADLEIIVGKCAFLRSINADRRSARDERARVEDDRA